MGSCDQQQVNGGNRHGRKDTNSSSNKNDVDALQWMEQVEEEELHSSWGLLKMYSVSR